MAHKKVEETNTKHQLLTNTTQYRNAINELEQLQKHEELILKSERLNRWLLPALLVLRPF